ncbi:putative TrmH family tRNA/rRNA methyltransferase [compost metagenome]
MILSSLQNPKIKQLRALHARKERQKQGRFLLETTKLLEEARLWRWPLEEVFATPTWLERHGSDWNAPVTVVAENLFGQLTTTETAEGVVAIAPIPVPPALPALAANSVIVALDALQDPGNLGTIIRTADAAGATAIVIGKGTVDPYSPKVVRSTMGSLFHLPVIPVADLYPTLDGLAEAGAAVVATSLGAERSLYDLDLKGPVVWLIGNEAQGLSEEALTHTTAQVRIPMPGHAESLNAAIAASVCLFETVRQRS